MIVRTKSQLCKHGLSNFELVVESGEDYREVKTLAEGHIVHVVIFQTVCVMGQAECSERDGYSDLLIIKDAVVVTDNIGEQFVERLALSFDIIDALEIIVSKKSEYVQDYYKKSNELQSLLF